MKPAVQNARFDADRGQASAVPNRFHSRDLTIEFDAAVTMQCQAWFFLSKAKNGQRFRYRPEMSVNGVDGSEVRSTAVSLASYH